MSSNVDQTQIISRLEAIVGEDKVKTDPHDHPLFRGHCGPLAGALTSLGPRLESQCFFAASGPSGGIDLFGLFGTHGLHRRLFLAYFS